MVTLSVRRDTPSPSPGEWVPCNAAMTRWKLVCLVCGGEGDEVDSPLDARRRESMYRFFLRRHHLCVDREAP